MTSAHSALSGLRWALASLLLFLTANAAALPREARVPGGIAHLLLPLPPRSTMPEATFAGQPVLVTRTEGGWLALVGLPLDLSPGEHRLQFSSANDMQELRFTVRDKRYPEQRLTLKNKGMVTLSASDERRALAEIDEIRALKKHWRATTSPDLDFTVPVEGRWSSRFGLRRVFNGEPRNPHVGLDIAVPKGTPIRSSAQGRVLAAGDYFFNGKTVFVDHGNGLLGMYCHLERIDVAPGQALARGQALGRSGASGRASGPHLHWSVILNGTMVDPELFLAQPR